MINIPRSELNFSFSRSSGAGGQNVNKVNTKATMSWDMQNSKSCSSFVKDRFRKKFQRFIIDEFVTIHSQKYRSQKQNIEDCITKLHACLAEVEFAQKKRRETKPSRSAVNKRLDKKSKDSKTKKMRSEKF